MFYYIGISAFDFSVDFVRQNYAMTPDERRKYLDVWRFSIAGRKAKIERM